MCFTVLFGGHQRCNLSSSVFNSIKIFPRYFSKTISPQAIKLRKPFLGLVSGRNLLESAGSELQTLMGDDSSGGVSLKAFAKHPSLERSGDRSTGRRDGGGEAEEFDAEIWSVMSESFDHVQSVLDKNKALIQQVNENHQSKIPDNLAKNVALIGEINGNISKVASLYSDLSANFSSLVKQRRASLKISGGNGNRSNREGKQSEDALDDD